MVYNRGMSKRKHHEPKTASTPATSQLTAAGIDFQVLEYEHDPDHMDQGYGIEAAARLGIDPKHVYKTLKADHGHERVIAVVPLDGHLSLNALAARIVVAGGKRGFDVSLKPQDLIAVLDAVTAPLSTW